MVHSNKKKWQPYLLKMRYKKYGYFTKKECIKMNRGEVYGTNNSGYY